MSHRIRRTGVALALVTPLALVAFAGAASATDGHEREGGTIYTETNASAGNAVIAIRTGADGLTTTRGYPTGGHGSGAGLGSQGALVASDGHLLAVNAGSNEVSLFSIGDDGRLALDDTEPSGGLNPISVTVHDDVAYVVNAGDRTVSGFRLHHDHLMPIAGSTRTLPGNGAAEISFDTTGTRLVITERATSTIDVLPVRHGIAGTPVSNPSTGQTPFGFAIDRHNTLIVSNATGGAAGASSVSSYRFTGAATLAPIGTAVADTQSAACWIALSGNGRYAYTTNTGSGTISSYRLARDGSLALDNPVAASPGAGPIDMVQTHGTLFTLNNGSHTVTAHTIHTDGSLTTDGQLTVPAGVVGLTAA